MNKFKQLFHSAAKMVRVYPVLYSLIFVVSLLATLWMQQELDGGANRLLVLDLFCSSLLALLACVITILWLEPRGKNTWWMEVAGSLLGFGLGLLIRFLWYAPTAGIFGASSCLVAIFLFFYVNRKENNLLSVLVKDVGFCLLSACAVMAGLGIVLFAVTEIIVSLSGEVLEIVGSCIFGFGFFFVPLSMMVTLLFKKEVVVSSGRGFKIFMLRVLFPLYLVLLAVLYVYLIKILVLQDMPSGLINWFVSYACAVFMFFYFVLEEFQQEKFVAIFRGPGVFLLLPLLAVQCLVVAIRVSAYGLTAQRWYSLLFMIFSFVFVVVTLVKGGRYRTFLFPLLAFLLVLASLSPFDGQQMAFRSQSGRIHQILHRYQVQTTEDFETALKDMNNQELEILEGAFGYLYFNQERTDPQISMLFPVYEDFFKEVTVERGIRETAVVKEFYYNVYSDFDNLSELELDISQYKTMHWYNYSFNTESSLEKKLLLPVGNGTYLDMTNFFLERLVDTSSNATGFDKDYLLVYQQDDLAIVFTQVSLLWNKFNTEDTGIEEGFTFAEIHYQVLLSQSIAH